MAVSLITGSNGFAGSHLAEYLLNLGHRVRCLVRKTSDLANLRGLEVEYCYGDVTSPDSLPSALEGADYVFHLAGATKARNEAGYMLVNAQGTENLARACTDFPGLKMLIYCSSLAAVGPQSGPELLDESAIPAPLTAYGRSKLAGEERLREVCGDKVPYTIVRPTGIYGPRDRDIFIYFKMISRGWKILLNLPDRKVSLIHAKDLAKICWLAASKSPPGETYLATDGNGYTWIELASLIEKALNRRAKKVMIPLSLVTAAAALMELSGGLRGRAVTLNREKIRELKAPGWVCSIDKVREKLGFEPGYSIENGIAETARWYRDNGWL